MHDDTLANNPTAILKDRNNPAAMSVSSPVVLDALKPARKSKAWPELQSGLSEDDGCNESVVRSFTLDDRSGAVFNEALAGSSGTESGKKQTAASVVTNCFIELSLADFEKPDSFYQRHKLGQRLGGIQLGTSGVCTAFLVGDGMHILTARHCFFGEDNVPLDAALLKAMYFQPAVGDSAYQLCAISDRDALDPTRLVRLGDDQVIVRIAPGQEAPAPVEVTDTNQLSTVEDFENRESGAAARTVDAITDVTLLLSITYMPSAKALHPESTGFVVGRNQKYAAIRKQGVCFSDVCRAVRGGSGAPVFDVSNSDAPYLHLVGTHNGSSGGWQDCTIGTANKSDINVAAFITATTKPFVSAGPQH